MSVMAGIHHLYDMLRQIESAFGSCRKHKPVIHPALFHIFKEPSQNRRHGMTVSDLRIYGADIEPSVREH